MAEFIALVVVIIATIYVFIKVKNSLQNKGKSKLASIFLALASSFLAFVVLVVLVATFFQDSSKQTQVQEPKQEIETTYKVEDKVVETPQEAIKDEPKQIQKEEKKSPPDTITTKLTFDVINSLKNNYGIEAGIFENMPLYLDKLCSSDAACQIYAGKIQIQVIYKSVIVNTNSKVSPDDYLEACSAVLIGLTEANIDLAEDIIVQGFSHASKNGSAKYETLGVEFKVEPDSMTGLLKCRFYKY